MALKLKGSTSGFVAIDAPSVAGNNTLILPENTGSAQQLLGNDITAGVVTFTSVTVNRNGDLTVPGTISIGGTLTYEDVTSVDSVGIVTARSGVRINGGGLTIIGDTTGLKASGISTFGGSVGIADSIIHTGDTDTSIRFPSANTITAETGGSERLRITSTGKVGISSDAPTSLLTVGGGPNAARSSHPTAIISPTSGNASLMLRGNSPTIDFDSTGGGNAQVCTDNAALIISAGTFEDTTLNAGEMVRIDATGRVLIGTTTEGHASADDLTIATSGATGITIRSGSSSNGNIFFSDATSGAGEYQGMIIYGHGNDSMQLYVNGGTRLTFNSGGNATFAGIVTATEFVATSIQTGGRKNLLFNGGMSIAQRGTAAVTVTTSAKYRCVDRFKTDIDGSGGGDFSHEQSTDVPTGQGFRHSSKCTVVTQASQPTSESNHHQIYQILEGQDIHHLEWGTSNAKTCTLSFWVKSSVAGTHALWFGFYGGTTYYYWTNYTINSANTWEKKTITITGPTSGNNVTAGSNASGFRVEWTLGVGSDSETGTLNEWTTSDTFRTASGTVYLPENAGATWYLTGVQFEVGSNASAYEFRSFGEEFALCQRYCQKSTCTAQEWIYVEASGLEYKWWQTYFNPMRATPTVDVSDLSTGSGTSFAGGSGNISSIAVTSTSNQTSTKGANGRVSFRITGSATWGTARTIHHTDSWSGDSVLFTSEL